MTIAEQWEAQGFRKGMMQGIEQGIEQGMVQEKRIIAQKLLMKGESVELVVQLTGLALNEVQNLVDLSKIEVSG